MTTQTVRSALMRDLLMMATCMRKEMRYLRLLQKVIAAVVVVVVVVVI